MLTLPQSFATVIFVKICCLLDSPAGGCFILCAAEILGQGGISLGGGYLGGSLEKFSRFFCGHLIRISTNLPCILARLLKIQSGLVIFLDIKWKTLVGKRLPEGGSKKKTEQDFP